MVSASPLHDRRRRALQAIAESKTDIVIIGGGIHGCAAAREAALQGLSVTLLEAHDFASGTSSRSSKMLHGGIRYLEQGDVSLVFEALRERAILLRIAAPFARAQPFLFPVIPGLTRPAWQVQLGLRAYMLLARLADADRRLLGFRTVEKDSPEARELHAYGLTCSHLFEYLDGQLDDTRICLEMALDARLLGAQLANYVRAVGVRYDKGERCWIVQWESEYPQESGELRASAVLDLRGPELLPFGAPSELPAVLADAGARVVLSRGSHALFARRWPLSGITLPTGTPGRYYFVWPFYFSRGEFTLVGTTDRFTNGEPHDVRSQQDEIDELLALLRRDLPNSGLDESTLYQTFAGVRSLVRSSRAVPGSDQFPRISRKHRWLMSDRYLALVGGKYTSARKTAAEGVRLAMQALGKKEFHERKSIERELPGAIGWSQGLSLGLQQELEEAFGAGGVEASEVVRRRGVSARQLLEPRFRRESMVASEVAVALELEWAVTLEDLMHRRLAFAYSPDVGMPAIDGVAREMVRQGWSVTEVQGFVEQYKVRWLARPQSL